jgi:hypothetical protein
MNIETSARVKFLSPEENELLSQKTKNFKTKYLKYNLAKDSEGWPKDIVTENIFTKVESGWTHDFWILEEKNLNDRRGRAIAQRKKDEAEMLPPWVDN